MELSVKLVYGHPTLVVIDNNGVYHVVKNCTDLSITSTSPVKTEDGLMLVWRGKAEFQIIS